MEISVSCANDYAKGGQGVYLSGIHTAMSACGNVTAYCTNIPTDVVNHHGVVPVGRSSQVRRIFSLPVLRRRKDWITLIDDRTFDQRVAARLRTAAQPCDLFIGVAMQSAESMRAVAARGGINWLYCLNSHISFLKKEVDREYKLQRDSGAVVHPFSVRRFRTECQLAQKILVNSHFARQTFLDAGVSQDKVHVVSPSVDCARFHPPSAPPKNNALKVLYVGLISPRKGVAYLLQALDQLQSSNFALTLVGGASTSGTQRLLDSARQRPNVDWLCCDFSADDPVSVFGHHDVLVLPSVEDGFGLVALEALASGVPAIVTSNCGAQDVIEDGVNGFIVPPRDPEAIRQKLVWLQQNPSALMNMRNAARDTALIFNKTRYDREIKALVDCHFRSFQPGGLVGSDL